jgi:hypothetical protein
MRDHQFINFKFMGMTTRAGSSLVNADGAPLSSNDLVFEKQFFSRPSLATPQQTATIEAMTDETFSALASIVGFVINDRLVDNKRGLAAATAHLIPSIFKQTGEMPGQYTIQQAQTYVAFKAMDDFYIHWGALADLYNRLPDDQQAAIDGFFTSVLNRPLRDMYSTYVPALSIPDSLKADKWSNEADNGLTYPYSNYLETWLREDYATNQFWVEGNLPDGQSTVFIGSAETLEEALGYASAYVMNANAGGDQAKAIGMFESISVDFNRDILSALKSYRRPEVHPRKAWNGIFRWFAMNCSRNRLSRLL